MDDERREKVTVRRLWVDAAAEYNRQFSDERELLYLSLCGAHGRDISLLAERQIIELNETGGIADNCSHRVAAVEFDIQAVATLQRRFPGLKIYNKPFQDLVRGTNRLAYPTKSDAEFCKARIINLDLNAPLRSTEDGEVVFPVLAWIQKLGELHSNPRRDWCLCLTLHGEIHWNRETSRYVQEFLRENFATAARFSEMSKEMLGEPLYNQIANTRMIDFGTLGREEQQKVLMIFVPKKLVQLMQAQGWKISTEANLRYGRASHAPMVTWIIHFRHSARATTAQIATYIESLNTILGSSGKIDGDGTILPDS